MYCKQGEWNLDLNPKEHIKLRLCVSLFFFPFFSFFLSTEDTAENGLTPSTTSISNEHNTESTFGLKELLFSSLTVDMLFIFDVSCNCLLKTKEKRSGTVPAYQTRHFLCAKHITSCCLAFLLSCYRKIIREDAWEGDMAHLDQDLIVVNQRTGTLYSALLFIVHSVKIWLWFETHILHCCLLALTVMV